MLNTFCERPMENGSKIPGLRVFRMMSPSSVKIERGCDGSLRRESVSAEEDHYFPLYSSHWFAGHFPALGIIIFNSKLGVIHW